MPEVVAWRLVLVAIPFAVWFIWRTRALRTGRDMGSTPYAWLVAAGAMLVGLSLLATAVFRSDNRHERYVPGEVTASGAVTKGYFERPTQPPASAPK